MSSKICSKCGEIDPTKFYGNKKTICGKCHNLYTIAAGKERRRKAVEFLGGQCKACGYKRYHVGLDIHHLDSEAKDPNFACMRGWSWQRIEKELSGCILLCKCCHAAVHAGELDIGV